MLLLLPGQNAVSQAVVDLMDKLQLYPIKNLDPNLAPQARDLLEPAIQMNEVEASSLTIPAARLGLWTLS